MIPDRYQLLETISTSARGTVCRGVINASAEEVVIKSRGTSLAAFHEREVRALEQIGPHPHVVRLAESGADASGSYLVLECLRGETVASRIERGPLDAPDLQNLARQGLTTLSAVHAAGLIHRDLAPDNLMLVPLAGRDFCLKLLDFELAQPLSATSADAATGSVHFMAPEQFEKKLLDERTDLYAFGAVLYFAASGRPPFEGDSNAQIITAHLRHRCRPLAELRHGLPAHLTTWIDSLISRDPADRPPNADAALARLDG